jgi:hypothetical protein
MSHTLGGEVHQEQINIVGFAPTINHSRFILSNSSDLTKQQVCLGVNNHSYRS